MKITFGKFQGWNTEDLAKTTEGRSYLFWGAENLKSPKWRDEFSKALKNASNLDINLETKAILASDSAIDENDAEMLAREIIADTENQERIGNQFDQAKKNLRQNLTNIGVPRQHINRMINIIVDGSLDEMIKAKVIQFSSKEKMENVLSCATQYEIEIESIDLW